MYQAVIFDMDDTLLDTFDARVRALQASFDIAGIRQPSAAAFFTLSRGVELREALSRYPATCLASNSVFEGYRRIYWTKTPGLIRLLPGIKEMLHILSKNGLRLAVITQKMRDFKIDGCRTGASLELVETGIRDLFSEVIGYEDVCVTKPDPEGINIILDRLNIKADKTLVVGDSPPDIRAAQAAGCRSCQAVWGISPEDIITESPADMIAKTPAELVQIILNAAG